VLDPLTDQEKEVHSITAIKEVSLSADLPQRGFNITIGASDGSTGSNATEAYSICVLPNIGSHSSDSDGSTERAHFLGHYYQQRQALEAISRGLSEVERGQHFRLSKLSTTRSTQARPIRVPVLLAVRAASLDRLCPSTLRTVSSIPLLEIVKIQKLNDDPSGIIIYFSNNRMHRYWCVEFTGQEDAKKEEEEKRLSEMGAKKKKTAKKVVREPLIQAIGHNMAQLLYVSVRLESVESSWEHDALTATRDENPPVTFEMPVWKLSKTTPNRPHQRVLALTASQLLERDPVTKRTLCSYGVNEIRNLVKFSRASAAAYVDSGGKDAAGVLPVSTSTGTSISTGSTGSSYCGDFACEPSLAQAFISIINGADGTIDGTDGRDAMLGVEFKSGCIKRYVCRRCQVGQRSPATGVGFELADKKGQGGGNDDDGDGDRSKADTSAGGRMREVVGGSVALSAAAAREVLLCNILEVRSMNKQPCAWSTHETRRGAVVGLLSQPCHPEYDDALLRKLSGLTAARSPAEVARTLREFCTNVPLVGFKHKERRPVQVLFKYLEAEVVLPDPVLVLVLQAALRLLHSRSAFEEVGRSEAKPVIERVIAHLYSRNLALATAAADLLRAMVVSTHPKSTKGEELALDSGGGDSSKGSGGGHSSSSSSGGLTGGLMNMAGGLTGGLMKASSSMSGGLSSVSDTIGSGIGSVSAAAVLKLEQTNRSRVFSDAPLSLRVDELTSLENHPALNGIGPVAVVAQETFGSSGGGGGGGGRGLDHHDLAVGDDEGARDRKNSDTNIDDDDDGGGASGGFKGAGGSRGSFGGGGGGGGSSGAHRDSGYGYGSIDPLARSHAGLILRRCVGTSGSAVRLMLRSAETFTTKSGTGSSPKALPEEGPLVGAAGSARRQRLSRLLPTAVGVGYTDTVESHLVSVLLSTLETVMCSGKKGTSSRVFHSMLQLMQRGGGEFDLDQRVVISRRIAKSSSGGGAGLEAGSASPARGASAGSGASTAGARDPGARRFSWLLFPDPGDAKAMEQVTAASSASASDGSKKSKREAAAAAAAAEAGPSYAGHNSYVYIDPERTVSANPLLAMTLFRLCRSSCLSLMKAASLLTKMQLLEQPPDQVSELQDFARSDGALLWHLYLSLDQHCHSRTQCRISSQLVALLTHENSRSSEVIRRCFPAGLLNDLPTSEITFDECGLAVQRGVAPHQGLLTGGACGAPTDGLAQSIQALEGRRGLTPMPNMYTPTDMGHGPGNVDPRAQSGSALGGLGNMLGMGSSSADDGLSGPDGQGMYNSSEMPSSKAHMAKQKEGILEPQGGGGGRGDADSRRGEGGGGGRGEGGGDKGQGSDGGGEKGMRRLKIAVGPMDGFDALGQIDGSADSVNARNMGYRLSMAGATVGGELYLAISPNGGAGSASAGGSLADAFQRGGFGGSSGGSPAPSPAISGGSAYDGGLITGRAMVAAAAQSNRSRGAGRAVVPACKCVVLLPEFFDRIRLPRIERPDLLWSRSAQRELCHRLLHEVFTLDRQRRHIASGLRCAANAAEEVADEMRPLNGAAAQGSTQDEDDDVDEGYDSNDDEDSLGFGGYEDYSSFFDGGYDDYGSGTGGFSRGSAAGGTLALNKSSRSDPLGEAWATVTSTSVVWNDSEFEVCYDVLASEVRVGRFYIRTLLDPTTGHLRCPEGFDLGDDGAGGDGKDESKGDSSTSEGKGPSGEDGKTSAPGGGAVAASSSNSPSRRTRSLNDRGGADGSAGGNCGGDNNASGRNSDAAVEQAGGTDDPSMLQVRVNASALQYNPLIQDPLGLMQLLYFRLTVERAPDVQCLVLQVMTQLMVGYGRFGTFGLCSLPFLGALVADARTKIRFITSSKGNKGNSDGDDGADFPLGVRGKLVAFLKHTLAEVEYVGEWLHAADYNWVSNRSSESEQSDNTGKASAASAVPASGNKPTKTGDNVNHSNIDGSEESWASEVERQVEYQMRRHLPSGYGSMKDQAEGSFEESLAVKSSGRAKMQKSRRLTIDQVQASQRHRIERLRHAVVWEGNSRRFIGGGGVELLVELMVELAPEVGRAVIARKEHWKRAALDRRRRERDLEAEKQRLLKAVADATNMDYKGAEAAEVQAINAEANGGLQIVIAGDRSSSSRSPSSRSPSSRDRSRSPVLRSSPSAPRGIRLSSPGGPPPAWLAPASADGLTATCLATLLRLVAAAPSVDPMTGAVLLPVPAIKRKLCEPALLRGLVDVIGTGDECITRLSVWLLQEVLRHHEEALPQVYRTGLFLQLLRYEGSSLRTLLPIAELLHLLHLRQALDYTNPLALAKPTPLEFDERQEGYGQTHVATTPSSPYLSADGSALYDTSPQPQTRGLYGLTTVNVNAMEGESTGNANSAAAGVSALLAIANQPKESGSSNNSDAGANNGQTSEEAEAMRLLQEMEGGPIESFTPQFATGGGMLSSQQHEHGQYVQPQIELQQSLTQGHLGQGSRPQLAPVNVTRAQLRAQAVAARREKKQSGAVPKEPQGGLDMQDGNQALKLALTKSVLRSLLPTCMVMQLLRHGPLAFARAFAADASDPEVIWSQSMRSQLRRHIIHFMDGQQTSQASGFSGASSTRTVDNEDSTDILLIPPMDYKEDETDTGTASGVSGVASTGSESKGGLQQLQCHGYFLRQLLDESRFGYWPIPAAGAFLRSLTAAVRGWMSIEEDAEAARIAKMQKRMSQALGGGLGDGISPSSPSSPAMNSPRASNSSANLTDDGEDDDATGAKRHRLSDGDVLLLVRTMGLLFRRALQQINGPNYSGSPTDPTAGYGSASGYTTLPDPNPGAGGQRGKGRKKRFGAGGGNMRLISARQFRHFVSAGPGAMRRVLQAREAAAASAAKAETKAQAKLAKAQASGSATDAASAKKALAKAQTKTLRLHEMMEGQPGAMAVAGGPQGFVYPANDGGFSGYTTLIRAVNVVLGDLAKLQSGDVDMHMHSPPSKKPNPKRLTVSRELLRRLLEVLATSMALHRPHPYFHQLAEKEEEVNPSAPTSRRGGSKRDDSNDTSAANGYANASACAAVGGVQCVAEVLEALAGDGLLQRDNNDSKPLAGVHAGPMAGLVDRAAGAWSPLDVRDRPAAAAALTSLARLLGSKEGLMQAQAIEEAAAVADTAQRDAAAAGAKMGGVSGVKKPDGAAKPSARQPTSPDGQPQPTQRLVHHVLKLLRLEDPYHDHELQKVPQRQQQYDCPAQDVASAALECVLAMARAEAFARPSKKAQKSSAEAAVAAGNTGSSVKGDATASAKAVDDHEEEGNCFAYITLVQALNTKGVAWHLMPWLLAYPSERDYEGYTVGSSANSSAAASGSHAAVEGTVPSLAAGQPSFDPLAGARRRGLLAGEATMLLLGSGPLGPAPAPPNAGQFGGTGYGARDQDIGQYGGREYERYERNVLGMGGSTSVQPARDMGSMGNVGYNVYVSCGLRNSLTLLLTSGLVTVLTTKRAADVVLTGTMARGGLNNNLGYRAVQSQVRALLRTLCFSRMPHCFFRLLLTPSGPPLPRVLRSPRGRMLCTLTLERTNT
jgi:hypothetical protein